MGDTNAKVTDATGWEWNVDFSYKKPTFTVKYAKENGGRIIGLSGFDGGVLRTVSDACVVVPANSTPHVEGMHLVLTHLMSEQLRARISVKKGARKESR